MESKTNKKDEGAEITPPVPVELKEGVIYTATDKFEKSIALEVATYKGISLDVGTTATQGFIGLSKDIITVPYEVDIGAGVTTKKNIYAGFHVTF